MEHTISFQHNSIWYRTYVYKKVENVIVLVKEINNTRVLELIKFNKLSGKLLVHLKRK